MEEAKFSPSESGLQRKTELRSVHSFHQNAMPFAPCATQGSKRDPFLLPALRRAPKETLFCSLRNAGLRKRPFFAPRVTQGPKETLFYSLRNAGPERHPFLLPA